MIKTAATSSLDPVVQVINPEGLHEVVLVCEHASAYIPPNFNNLGLDKQVATSHIAWDPGALETATAMSKHLNAVLVAGCVSRLVYDCNRPPEAPSAMPDVSEIYTVPGNQDLSHQARRARTEIYYRPFEQALKDTLLNHAKPPVVVTIHSFTPTFLGQERDVEIGILHDQDARLADAVLSIASGYDVRRNQPYGPEDGVTHTLRRHALRKNLLNVMIEVRNDLIASPDACSKMAQTLSHWFEQALTALRASPEKEERP
nr:N-formylglutamate amidohydrolase [Roseovarius sp. W115]MDV2929060.1 N-formylglutamate amidohydrolase [Roseovarius sp. W115]